MEFRRIATIGISVISLLLITGFALQDIFTSSAGSVPNSDSFLILSSALLFYGTIIFLARSKNLKHPKAISWIIFILCLSPILWVAIGLMILLSSGRC